MTDYQELYILLFNAMTDAVVSIVEQNFGMAAEILKTAQIQAEERYVGVEGPE